MASCGHRYQEEGGELSGGPMHQVPTAGDALTSPELVVRVLAAHPAHVSHAGVGSGETRHHLGRRQDERAEDE
jgi:hypothetical protein